METDIMKKPLENMSNIIHIVELNHYICFKSSMQSSIINYVRKTHLVVCSLYSSLPLFRTLREK